MKAANIPVKVYKFYIIYFVKYAYVPAQNELLVYFCFSNLINIMSLKCEKFKCYRSEPFCNAIDLRCVIYYILYVHMYYIYVVPNST